MARAIDADFLKDVIEKRILAGLDETATEVRAIKMIVGVLDATPTVDPVIRCRDCAVPHNKWTGCPKLNGLVPPDNFYCAFGVRRDSDGKVN